MLRPRIIPCLLVHQGGLVKTVEFKAPRYVGDPINAVKIFNEKETDELAVLDIDATVHQIEPNFKLIANLAAECRMPLCYGGGVKRADQARKIIGLGVEKVAISSAAIERPALIREASSEIGAQSVVVVLDVRSGPKGGVYEIWTHNGQRNTGRSLVDVAQEVESLGAGEIVINAIDRDGIGKGYDLDLARTVRQAVHVPITLLGGAGSLHDIRLLVEACGIVGAAAGSLFVFKGPYRAVLINYPNPSAKDELVMKALPTH
ncbi:AglZ/HisF2 family acetamidino modification protein [Geothrix sp. 21YS21S-4]|uniref:AglZ/HisF2 family acetamidino modification protein n=1 Tax=Geothrix sp. 21YS21S-4 TaxID=3068889 RepID=UPI0027B9EAE5|nr:AglZ/HisF2 family acetamidino modification protein [Geothrix sp. 21YS21S-4]